MNASLFQDLYHFINTDTLKRKILEDEFFFYLIGYYSTIPTKTIDYSAFPNDTLKYIHGRKKLRDALGTSYPEMLERNKNLHLQDLFWEFSRHFPQDARQAVEKIPERLDEIQGLYQTHKIPIPTGKNAENLLLHLFNICVTESRKQLFASYKNQLLKPSTIESITGREADARKLKDDIDTYHKVTISAEYGAGKSYFVQYCLNQWKPQDYCYLFYGVDLESTLSEIKYQDDQGKTYKDETANELRDKTISSPLLIIDNMYSSENFSKDLRQLSSYPVDIIVITTANIKNDFFHSFTMSALSDESLESIFEHCSGTALDDENLFKKMLQLTQRNPLMVSLLANQYKGTLKSSQEYKHQHNLDRILSSLETLDNHIEPNDKFKHPHDKKSLDLIGHVKYIYKNISEHMGNYLRDTMKYLCCFGWSPIPFAFMEVMPFYKKEDLDTLSNMGLLCLTAHSVQVTSLISHAVFAAENPSARDYDLLVRSLTQFLKEYDKTLSVPYLSDTLFIFANSLYNKIGFSNNGKKQEKTAKIFEEWQELLYLIVNYYKQCGEFLLARKLTTQICYPEAMKNAHSSLDKDFFLLDDDMQQFNIDGKEIDELCVAIYNNPNLLQNADFSFFFIYTMDKAVYFYLQNLLTPYSSNQKYIILFSKIFDYISENRSSKILMPAPKLLYYRLCFSLMNTPPIMFEPNNIKNHISQIKKWEYADYRIRGTAFLLSIQSQYLLFLCQERVVLHGSISISILNNAMFSRYHVPMITYLNEQIQQCKLISYQACHLCFLAYINALVLQYLLLKNCNTPKPPIPLLIQKDTIKDLLHRCTLSKKEKDDIAIQWDKSFSELLKLYQ